MGKNIKRERITKLINKADLTAGEIYFLNRRKLGLSQNQMAAKMGLSYYNYKMIEYDRVTDYIVFYTEAALYPHEKCVIYRRRADIPQHKIANKIKVSRYWLTQMELGEADCTRLLNWWENQYAPTNN